MAEYTPNLDLFRPGTDPNLEVEGTLDENFLKIDEKLGDSLTDRANKKWASLGERLNDEQEKFDVVQADVTRLKNKSVNVLFNHHYFRCIALRGAPRSAPLNTLIGYRIAVEWGYWGIYADAQLTSDNHWVMFSDTTVDNLTTGTGTLRNMTLAQVKALDVGTKFNQVQFGGEQIASLEDYLLILRSTQCVPVINLVGTYTDIQIKSLVDILTDWSLLDDAVVVSNQLSNLQRVRIYTPILGVGLYIPTHTEQSLNDIQALGNGFALYADSQVTKDNVRLAHSKNVPIVAFMHDDRHKRIRELIALGIRGVVTANVPAIRGV